MIFLLKYVTRRYLCTTITLSVQVRKTIFFFKLKIPQICIPASAPAAMVTTSADSSVSNGVYVPGGITNGDVKPALNTTPLADFLMQLEEYTPTVNQVVSVRLPHATFTGREILLERTQILDPAYKLVMTE